MFNGKNFNYHVKNNKISITRLILLYKKYYQKVKRCKR